MFKKTLIGVAIATGSLIGLAPTTANAYTTVITVAPPAPLHEVRPPPRHGYVWVPGHHEWRGHQYVWLQGHWVRDRHGYEYREPRWVQRADGHWYLVGNNWERRSPNGDLDHDGIVNRRDHHPNDPSRS
jgi:hypothetical protein